MNIHCIYIVYKMRVINIRCKFLYFPDGQRTLKPLQLLRFRACGLYLVSTMPIIVFFGIVDAFGCILYGAE